MTETKENAVSDYLEMVSHSWTWDRMTEDERRKFIDTVNDSIVCNAVKGNLNHRWNILNALYHIYLEGLGYDGFHWRENKEEEV